MDKLTTLARVVVCNTHLEPQAKKLLCPSTFNASPNQYYAQLCLGGQCMAWHWVPGDLAGETRGYCGLAGTPAGLAEYVELRAELQHQTLNSGT